MCSTWWGDVSRIANELIALVELVDANALRLLIGEIQFDKLKDVFLATKAGKAILDSGSSDILVLSRLNQLFLRMEDFEHASVSELQLLQLEQDDADKIRRYYSLADLYLLRLDNPEQARECYESIIDLDDADLKAFGSLRELYRTAEHWSDLRELDEEFVHRVADGDRYEVLVEIRDVLTDKLFELEL